MRRALIAFAAMAASGAANAAEQLRFVTCPIYRDVDAGKKSGCWLADDHEGGPRYDVSKSPTKPDWNFEVLVEGQVATGNPGNPCGGVVLDPVRVSILDTPCARTMLPAEGYKGRPFVLPARNVRPLYAERKPPAKPWADQAVHIPFDFNNDYVVYQLSDYLLDEALVYGRAVNAQRYVITGYAATDPVVVSGHSLAEPAALAQARAEKIKSWLIGYGVPESHIELHAETGSQPIAMDGADGLVEPSRRRATLQIIVEAK